MLAGIFDFLVKLIGPSAVLAVLVGIGAGVAWENRPSNWPNVQVLFFTLGTGDGLGAQRDKAMADAARWNHAFLTERAAFVQMAGAVDAQNASIRRAAADSLAWQARSEDAVAQARRTNAWRLKLADTIRDTPEPAGEDALTQCRAAESVLRVGGQ